MAFNILPIELNKEIAHYLDSDKDICNFRLICKNASYAVDGDGLSFWRALFRQKYALNPSHANSRLMKVYQKRRKWLRQGSGLTFHLGHTTTEIKVLEILIDLINESFTGEIFYDRNNRPYCRNQLVLKSFLESSRNFAEVNRPSSRAETYHARLAALQLMSSHLLLDCDDPIGDVYGFDASQKAVYETAKVAPIFHGFNNQEINMEWVLHVMNFFRYYMMPDNASTLSNFYQSLEDLVKPSQWRGKLKEGSHKLEPHWKGTYAFLERNEIRRIRSRPAGSQIFVDRNVDCCDDDPIQTLRIEFNEGEKMPWFPLWEQHLRSNQKIHHAKTRAQHKSATPSTEGPVSLRLEGTGRDVGDNFLASGWLNPLPSQWGIPGWQRITFMKYFKNDAEELETECLWAYEGVVLPGGKIILGRWWHVEEDAPYDEAYSGPFIFWNVDERSIKSEESEFAEER